MAGKRQLAEVQRDYRSFEAMSACLHDKDMDFAPEYTETHFAEAISKADRPSVAKHMLLIRGKIVLREIGKVFSNKDSTRIVDYADYDIVSDKLASIEPPLRLACDRSEFDKLVSSVKMPAYAKHPLITSDGNRIDTVPISLAIKGKLRTYVPKPVYNTRINYRDFDELNRHLAALAYPGKLFCTREEFDARVAQSAKPSEIKHSILTESGDIITTSSIINVVKGNARLTSRGVVNYSSYDAVAKALAKLSPPVSFAPDYGRPEFDVAIEGKPPGRVCHHVANKDGDVFVDVSIDNIVKGRAQLVSRLDYTSFDAVLGALGSLVCPGAFPDTYTRAQFDATVAGAKTPASAIHPVEADGRVIDNMSIGALLHQRRDLFTPETRQAQIRHTNAIKHLGANEHLSVVSTVEDMRDTDTIVFACDLCEQHTTYNWFSFANKMYKAEASDFCPGCTRDTVNGLKLVDTCDEIQAKTGHIVTSCEFGGTRMCEYQCGNCGTKVTSTVSNLRRNTGFCAQCVSTTRRVNWHDMCAELITLGFKLAMVETEYTSNKKICVMCPCGSDVTFVTSLHRLRNGTRCGVCKPERIIATVQERFGADIVNVFQSEYFKQLMIKKYGVPNPMQNRLIFENAMRARCAQKYAQKQHTLSSGNTVTIQGYEGYALDYILDNEYVDPFLERKLSEDDILLGGEIESVEYELDGKTRTYHPDMQVRDTNVFYEIKSWYTLWSDWDKNQAKFRTMAEKDKRLVVMVMDKEELLQMLLYNS